MRLAEILQANATSAGLIGVILGALITFTGNVIQTIMKNINEKRVYKRTYQEKICNEKKALYAKCLTELRDVSKQVYYTEEREEQGQEKVISGIKLECESMMELEASSEVQNELKEIVTLNLQDTEIEEFEKKYDKLVKAMRNDIQILL